MVERIVRGERVLIDGQVRRASVHIANGVIEAIAGYDEIPEGAPVTEAGDAVVMPGIVDTHVHVNEPGRTEWEGFETATAAAAAGGVTTLVDMPLNSVPPTTTVAALAAKREAARGRVHVDVGFWGGVVPGNAAELDPMLADGILGFKCFLIDSGVAEFRDVGEADLVPAMEILAAARAPLLVHAEVAGPVDAATGALAGSDPRRYDTFLRSRPREAENQAIELTLRSARATGAPVHIVHHSSADALAMLRAAREDGLALTVETCPHYLHFAAEDIADGATEFKCCPPIRERDNREQLWDALRAGVIDMVVSDHSPCTPDLKRDDGDFMAAWGGIAGLQLALRATWTDARARGFDLATIARWMCEQPARLAGLAARKGRLARGYDADLVVWHPEREFTVDGAALEHRHAVTPYAGERLAGEVELTILRGRTIYERQRGLAPPSGDLLRRT